MTNNDIILNESIRLMELGKIKGTGRYMTIHGEDGDRQIEQPEQIHTFNGWKARGYKVKKGERSTIRIAIWKRTERAIPEEELTGNPIEDAPIVNMFMKVSAFFTTDQVEPIKAQITPEDVKTAARRLIRAEKSHGRM